MNTKVKYLTRTIQCLIYGVALASTSVLAQQNDLESNQETDTEIEKIEVTSSRRIQTIQDVPASVVAIKPEEFVQRGMISIADVIGQSPGFSITSTNGQSGRGSISARGVSAQSDGAVTAMYLDDVPLSSNSGFAAGGRLFYDGLLGDIERIELIKGPQGTLFGATSMAGAIRYITRKPELEEGRGKVTADVSQTKGGDLNHIYRGYYSLPIIQDKLGITVAGYTSKNGGFVDQVDPASGEVIKENANESDDEGYSVDLYYQATNDLSIRLKALKQETSFGLSSAVRIASLNKDETYGEFKSDNAFGNDDFTQEVYSASISYEMDFATLDFTSSRTDYASSLSQDTVSIYGPLLEQLNGFEEGSILSVPFINGVSSEKTSHEARLTSKLNNGFEWIAGLFYTDEGTTATQDLFALPQEVVGAFADFPSEYNEMAGFGNLTYYINEDFDLTAGIRLSKTDQTLIFRTDGPLLGGFSEEELEDADDTVQTYLLTARYRPNDDTSYYARIASGYRPASSNLTVFNPFTGEQLSQPIVHQDDLISYELGIKGTALSDGLRYEASAYYIDWDNFQTNLTFFGVTSGGNAEGGITSQGFEAVVEYALTRDVTVSAHVAHMDSTLNEDEPGLFGAKGESIPNVPDWTLASNIQYNYELDGDAHGWIAASLQYKDSTRSSFDSGDPEDSSINLDSDNYTVINLTTGLVWSDFTVTLYANNLLDQTAYSRFSANVIPGTDIVDVTGVPIEPRKVGVSLSYSF